MRRLLKARELGLPEGDMSTLERTGGHRRRRRCRHDRSRPRARACCRDMLRIRRFEEKCAELYGAGQDPRLPAPVHRRGGGGRRRDAGARRADDAIVATYREHGHALARGIPMNAIMAEMYGKREGCSPRPRRLDAPVRRAPTRFYGGNAIVGGGLPLAVGLALADKMQGRHARHGLLLRRRRGGRGRVPRVAEPGRAVAAAGAVLLREQPLCDGHGARRAPSRRPTSASRRAATRADAERSTAWTSWRCHDGGATRCRARARRRGPVLRRVPDLPLPRALDVRPGAVPRQGRSRGVEEARPDPRPSRARLQARASSPSDDVACARRGRCRGGRARRSPSPRPARGKPSRISTRDVLTPPAGGADEDRPTAKRCARRCATRCATIRACS